MYTQMRAAEGSPGHNGSAARCHHRHIDKGSRFNPSRQTRHTRPQTNVRDMEYQFCWRGSKSHSDCRHLSGLSSVHPIPLRQRTHLNHRPHCTESTGRPDCLHSWGEGGLRNTQLLFRFTLSLFGDDTWLHTFRLMRRPIEYLVPTGAVVGVLATRASFLRGSPTDVARMAILGRGTCSLCLNLCVVGGVRCHRVGESFDLGEDLRVAAGVWLGMTISEQETRLLCHNLRVVGGVRCHRAGESFDIGIHLWVAAGVWLGMCVEGKTEARVWRKSVYCLDQ